MSGTHAARSSIRGKMLLSVIGVLVAATGTLAVVTMHRVNLTLERDARDKAMSLLRNLAVGAELGVLAESAHDLRKPVQALLALPEIRYVALYSAEGRTIVERRKPEILPEIPLDLSPELRRRLDANQDGIQVGIDNAGEERLRMHAVVDFLVPVRTEPEAPAAEPSAVDPSFAAPDVGPATSGVIGYARLGYSFRRLEAERARGLRALATGWALVLAAGVGVAHFLAGVILRPLRKLDEGVANVARGEFRRHVEISARDEIGEVAGAFNQMVDRLRSSRERIEEQNLNLERKVHERTERLEAALRELVKLDEMKDAFLSSVSHELRTPLTSIRAFAEILLQYGDEDRSTRDEFLGIIHKESERLTRLVNDVLDLSRMEAGKMTWSFRPRALAEIVEASIQAVRPLLDENALRLAADLPPDLPPVVCDADRVQQVILNLLSNAANFSPSGGAIRVAARLRRDHIRLMVRDRGPGIARAHHGEIFERFKQVGDPMTAKPAGTGLGLPISKGILRRHGGRIWVKSSPGRGAAFFFTLPLAGPEPSAAPAAHPPEGARSAPPRLSPPPALADRPT